MFNLLFQKFMSIFASNFTNFSHKMGLTYSSALEPIAQPLLSSKPDTNNKKPPTALPLVGKGEYEVGCADVMICGKDASEGSGIFARLFYPTTLKSEPPNKIQSIHYPVWRPRYEYIKGLADYRQISPFKIQFFLDWVVGERRLPAGWHEPFYSQKSQNETADPVFPVIIFSHGISGNRLCYSTFCSSLASCGYVVAAIEHRDRSSSWTYYLERNSTTKEVVERPIMMTTFPDGEEEFKERNLQVQERVLECVRCLNFLKELNLGQYHTHCDEVKGGSKIIHGDEYDWSQFKGRLDVSKAAVVGHSFGGATAIAAAAHSEEFQSSVVLDGWLYPLEEETYARTKQPALMLNASRWQWKDNVKRMKLFERLSTTSEKLMFTLKDIVHQSFSDFAFLMPGYLAKMNGLQGELDPRYTGSAIVEIVDSFLRQTFCGRQALDAIRDVVKPYEHFIVEGTDMNLSHTLDEENPKDELTKKEEGEFWRRGNVSAKFET